MTCFAAACDDQHKQREITGVMQHFPSKRCLEKNNCVNWLLGVLFVFIVGDANFAAAANLREPQNVSEREMGCSVVLEGEITDGDHEKFVRLVSQRQPGLLCLNSPGGDFGEALQIAAELASTTYILGTALPENATCESACAIIFMFGTHAAYFGGTAEYYVADRRMHRTAELGFHTVAIALEDDDIYSGEEVIQAFEVGMRSVSGLLQLRDQMPNPIWSDALIMRMLNTPANEMWYVTTVHEAVQMGIQVVGVSEQLHEEMDGTNFCQSLLVPLNVDPVSAAPTRLRFSETERNHAHFESLTRGFGWSVSCEVRLEAANSDGFDNPLDGILAMANIRHPRIGEISRSFSQGHFSFYPPETLISQLPIGRTHDVTPSMRQVSTMFRHIIGPAEVFEQPNWCTNAGTATERLICADAELSRIDIAITNVFAQVQSNDSARSLARERLAIRNSCGADYACLLHTTQQTLGLLEGFLR